MIRLSEKTLIALSSKLQFKYSRFLEFPEDQKRVALNSLLFSQPKSKWIDLVNSLNRLTIHYRYPKPPKF